jgi:hypothetical protein
MTGYLCSAPLYQYRYEGKVWTFEYQLYLGPWPVRKDGELYKRASKTFYQMFEAFQDEPDREQYRIGGGCIPFGEGA